MSLIKAIKDKLERNHKGKDRPLPLEDLLEYLFAKGNIPRIDKNEERRVRSTIAKDKDRTICNAGNGYYIARKAGHKEDVQEAVDYIQKTYVVPLHSKIAEKKKAFPQYYPNFNPDQMDLPL